MKRLMMVLVAVLVLAPVSLWAQDAKADVFGGFSWLSIGDGGTGAGRFNPVGWQASVAGHMNNKFSIVGDFGGQYKSGIKVMEYVGGPRITHKVNNKASVFGHAMFGGHHTSDGTDSLSGFTMAYGGGVDVTANEKMAIRVIQFDWVPSRETEAGVSAWEKNVIRMGFGVVFKIAK
jgi:hypothetical protein